MRRGGFSLVEISIVLVVVATMLAGVLPAITEGTKVRDIDTTSDRMEAIQGAIQSYFAVNQELPCPADITLGVSTANFGVQAANNSCTGGTPAANWTSGANLAGGGVPTKTLGLPDEYAFDGWGRRIYYHVDPDATVAATFNAATTGTITVNDGAGTPRTTSAVYALVSAGRNGHGAFTRAGGTVRLNSGSVNTDERANCQTTGTVCSGTAAAYDTTLVQKLEIATNPTDPTTNFDDIVTYKLRGNLLTGDGSGGGDTLWTAAGANIHNTNMAGNVGVGTSTPSSKLHVVGGSIAATDTAANAAISAQTSLNGGVAQLYLSNTAAGGTNWALNAGNTATGVLGASLGIAEGANYRMVIQQGGNVGIGTSTPLGRLTVANDVGLSELYFSGNNISNIFSEAATQPLFINTSGGRIALGAAGSGTEQLNLLSNGNVGIGTTSPGARLHSVQATATQNAVHGTYNGGGTTYYGVGASAGAYWAGIARADGYGLVTNGHIYTTGDMYYFGFLYDLSDERDKKDIKPLSSQDVLARILKIRPVSFKMKEDKKDRTELGVIAQELEKIFPELVSTAEDEKGSKSVNLIGLIAPMIGAIQEQNEMIEAQKKRIDTLEERMKQLEESFD